jgi:hypothetical protein
MVLALVAAVGAHAGESAALVASGPNANAPEQVQQFGQLMGNWSCQGSAPQPDGSWQDSPSRAAWTWYYVLDGFAVQDVWKPGNPKAPMGTNLRTYDAETDSWLMVWATQTQARFDHFTATFQDGQIVMLGDRWARPAFAAHKARITFFNIDETHYDWKYEGSTDGETWSEQSRLDCDRDD